MWQEVGRTEVVPDNQDPNFVKSMIMKYYFEESQKVAIKKIKK